MMRKYKFFLFFFIFLFVLFIFFWGIKATENDKMTFIESLIPEKVKIILKQTIFSNTTRYKINKIKANLVFFFSNPVSVSYELKSRSHIYNIKTFDLPLLNYGTARKPVAYLEQTDSDIIVITGSGQFFSFKKKDIESNNLNLKRIKSNIKKLIKYKKFYTQGFYSVRDLLILDNKIFFSYVKEYKKDCYNTSIMVAEFNLNNFNFSEFFSHNECIYADQEGIYRVNPARSGGRIVFFKDDKILITIGDYGYGIKSQDKNSLFGKIIEIDLETKSYGIISMGSRNAQGLYYDEDKDVIIFTEHGPKGGDEININLSPDTKIVENYGWPISSYGEHYDVTFKRKETPFHKSHKDYGFVEPIKYYTFSVAISEIIKVPNAINEKFTNDFFVGTMGSKKGFKNGALSVHHIRFNENFDKVIFEDVIPIGERIRDMIFIKEKNIVLMVLESIPAIGVLKLKK